MAAAAAATALAAAYVEESVRGERAWRALRRDYAAEGRPLDYAHYRPASVPDEKNFFRAPVVQRYLDPAQAAANAAALDKMQHTVPPEVARRLGRWEQGEFLDLAAVSRSIGGNPAADPTPGEAAAAVLAHLAPLGPDLDALRQAARTRPLAQIEFRDDCTFVPNIFAVLRVFGTALPLRASTVLSLGRASDAAGDVLASLRLAEGAAAYPSQVHLVFANGLGVRALQPLWEGLQRGDWSDADLAAFQDALDRLRPLRTVPAAFDAAAAAAAYFAPEGPWWMPEGWRQLNRVELLRSGAVADASAVDAVRETVDLVRLGAGTRRHEALMQSRSPFTWSARRNAWSPKMVVYVASAQTAFSLADTACALERFRRAEGAYPARLDALVPRYLARTPHDVFGGGPLRYSLTESGHYLLYSVGSDGTDDHGAPPAPGAGRYLWTDAARGDWAWPNPLPATGGAPHA